MGQRKVNKTILQLLIVAFVTFERGKITADRAKYILSLKLLSVLYFSNIYIPCNIITNDSHPVILLKIWRREKTHCRIKTIKLPSFVHCSLQLCEIYTRYGSSKPLFGFRVKLVSFFFFFFVNVKFVYILYILS